MRVSAGEADSAGAGADSSALGQSAIGLKSSSSSSSRSMSAALMGAGSASVEEVEAVPSAVLAVVADAGRWANAVRRLSSGCVGSTRSERSTSQ